MNTLLKRLCLTLLLMLNIPLLSRGMEIDIRVFSEYTVSEASFTVVKGYYHMDASGYTKTWSRFQTITLRASGNRVEIWRNDSRLARAHTVILHGAHEENIFRLITKNGGERDYEDDLEVRASGGQLILVNNVDLENYIAGVVLSEVGKIETIEYYKIQDIISRTYALKNLKRHALEGYNLCDAQHCQVYNSRCLLPVIRESISVTRGDVIVDSSGELITAAFHSNSGGHTMNSEDVWTSPLSYLRAVPDTFSESMSKARWQDTIPLASWLVYLGREFKLPLEDSAIHRAMHFEQPPRKTRLWAGVPLKQIRSDWKLKSTFFSLIPDGDQIIIDGRGWGHGVGLSQQGAMRMIELGYDYEEVITYYYTGVKIVRLSQLKTLPKP